MCKIFLMCSSATPSKCSSDGFFPNHCSNHAPPIITVSTVLSSMSKQQLSKMTPSIGRFSIGGTRKPKPSCCNKSPLRYRRLITHTSTNGMLLSVLASWGTTRSPSKVSSSNLVPVTIDAPFACRSVANVSGNVCKPPRIE
uniref:Uncharacterized protein n=1 Tax=Anopheles coluzzii TaxID=1518534 RepID=A0A8W7PAW7_ANOCL